MAKPIKPTTRHKLPDYLRQAYSTPAKRKNHPARNFLDGKGRRYPVRAPDGRYHCDLVWASVQRARMLGDKTIQRRAEALYRELEDQCT